MVQQKNNLLHLLHFVVQVVLVNSFSEKCNPFQCDMICPDVHVETCTPTFQCATQTYEPRPCCRCCPPAVTAVHMPMAPSCCSFPCHFPRFPSHSHPAPSYCVQSVVVGGSKHDIQEPHRANKTSSPSNPISGSDRNPVPSNNPYGNTNGIGDGDGTEPKQYLQADPNIDQKETPSNNTSKNSYESYIEKILDLVKCKLEPEKPPVVVVSEPAPEVRVKAVRRKKQKKYKLTSCEEEPCEPVVVVEEEEEPSYVFHTRPSCCLPCRRCLPRCRCCC